MARTVLRSHLLLALCALSLDLARCKPDAATLARREVVEAALRQRALRFAPPVLGSGGDSDGHRSSSDVGTPSALLGEEKIRAESDKLREAGSAFEAASAKLSDVQLQVGR